MTFSLAPDARAAGYRLVAHDTIGSTNAEAMTYARAGETGPLWLVSDHQTAGRGRRGNNWSTPRGNLAASLLLTLDLPAPRLATLGFVAGVALIRALDALPPPAGASAQPDADRRYALKWPNDVLAGDGKLSGILLETEEARRGRTIVIGLGVNVAHAPDGPSYATTSLARFGVDTSAADLFLQLSSAWVAALTRWDEGRGFASIRADWLARAAGLGRPITIRQGGTERAGIFETIDDDGQLALRDRDGALHLISAGEVHFGGAGTLRTGAAA